MIIACQYAGWTAGQFRERPRHARGLRCLGSQLGLSKLRKRRCPVLCYRRATATRLLDLLSLRAAEQRSPRA